MNLDDFKIHSTDKLDSILAECCRQVLLHRLRGGSYWGMVGACVLGNRNNPVFGVNHTVDGGFRCHAEVAAYQNYIKKYGSDGLDGAIIITTLSPCSSDIDQPGGINCTEFINSTGIRKVYCGFSDPSQIDTPTWRHKKFHIVETRNRALRDVCCGFASTFLDLPDSPKDIDLG